MPGSYVCDFCGGKKSYGAQMCLTCRGKETKKERKHGTVNMYVNFGCRCSRCRVAWAEERRRQRSEAKV